MNISKRSLKLLILCMIIPVLLGNDTLFSSIGITKLIKLIYFAVPAIYIISFLLDCKKNKFKFKFDILSILCLIFIAACTISIPFGINISFNSFTNLVYMFYIISFIYSIHIYNFEKNDIDNILKWMIITLLTVSIIGIIQYIFRIDLLDIGIKKYPGAIGRIYSTMSNATHLDKYLLYNLVIVLYLMYKNKKNNIIYYIAVVLATIALAFTYSRTGIICYYMASLLFDGLYILKKNYKSFAFILAVLVMLYFIPGQNSIINSTVNYATIKANSIITKLKPKEVKPATPAPQNKPSNNGNSGNTTPTPAPTPTPTPAPTPNKNENKNELDASNSSRESFNNIAIAFIKKYTVSGIGIGNYNYVVKNQNFNDYIDLKLSKTNEYRYTHNMFLYMFVETGIISVLSFVSILIYEFIQMIKNKNTLIALVFVGMFILTSLFEPIVFMRDVAPMFIIMYSLLTKKSYDSNL